MAGYKTMSASWRIQHNNDIFHCNSSEKYRWTVKYKFIQPYSIKETFINPCLKWAVYIFARPFFFFVDFILFWLFDYYWWGDLCCRQLNLCMLTFARWVFRLVVWNFYYRMFVMTILKNNFSKIYVLNEK